MNPEVNNSKTECDHFCHSCIHNITEEKDGLYYHKCLSKTETKKTKNSKTGGYDYEMR